jgi:hypothetical protein
MISERAVFRRSGDVRYRHVPPETVVVRVEVPETMVLNEVGGRVLELLDGCRRVEEVLAAIVAEFDVERGQARADLLRFLGELRSCGALEEVDDGHTS